MSWRCSPEKISRNLFVAVRYETESEEEHLQLLAFYQVMVSSTKIPWQCKR